MSIDRGPKVDTRMYEANIKLQSENRSLRYDITMLEKKIKNIKSLCEAVDKNYPECKAYASRILFIINNEYGEDE